MRSARTVEALRRLRRTITASRCFAVHAPCLLITQRVWGREPWGKMVRAKDVGAGAAGARGVVVVHPPFHWQREYARDFTASLGPPDPGARPTWCSRWRTCSRSGPGGAEVRRLDMPSWNPVPMDYPARHPGPVAHGRVRVRRARHERNSIGPGWPTCTWPTAAGWANRDEHLVPGRGAPAVLDAAAPAGRPRDYQGLDRAGGQDVPCAHPGSPAGVTWLRRWSSPGANLAVRGRPRRARPRTR